MVNCYKCGNFYLFGTNYDGLCEDCHNIEKLREEEERKQKEEEERKRKEKQEEKERKQREKEIRQLQEKRIKALEAARERKKREKEMKAKKEEEERKLKEKQEKIKEMIPQKLISNPNILLFYKHILDMNKNVIDIENELKKLTTVSIKIKFEDVLMDNIFYKVMKNNIFAIECETKSYIDINIYSATKFFNEKYISDYIYNFYTRKEQENGFWDLYEKNKKMYYKEGKKEFEYRYQRRQLENKIVRLYFSLVDFLAATIAYLLNLSDSIKEFSNCKDLETMYENLRNVTDDVEYIRDKLYPIYQKFYENEFEKKLSKEDFGIIIALKENLTEDKEINIKINKTNLKSSLISYMAKEYGKVINVEENKYIYIIGKVLSNRNNLEPKAILKIINNLDKILEDINQKACLDEAEDERARILKGDLSKEIEMKKLSLDINNIENGFAFEEYVANLYKNLGYTIEEVTKKSGDQGADVIAYKDNLKYVIQAKYYTGAVGNKAVQEVVASMSLYKADKGIVITNSSFTMAAMELAVANKIELVDGEKIEQYIQIILKNL